MSQQGNELTMDNNKKLSVISWNVNGLNSRGHEVHYYVIKHNVDVILLQETRDAIGNALQLNGYKKYQLLANGGARGMATFVKNTVPSELIDEPIRIAGVESVCVKVHLREGILNVVNVYISSNYFSPNTLPNSVFNNVTLVAGDYNARYHELERDRKNNGNGVKFWQFLQDYPDITLLGNKIATHILGGRLDYACIVNGQGLRSRAAGKQSSSVITSLLP